MENFKLIKALKTKKGRDEQNRFIIEGEKAVAEIPADWHIHLYVFAEGFRPSAQPKSGYSRAKSITVSDSRFASLSDTVTPQGVLAVCKKKSFGLEDVQNSDFLLIGEGLADPGNIGALIRTAAAAGAQGIILSKGTGDLYNPKVLRAAAGAALRIPVVEGVDLAEAISYLKREGVFIAAAHLQGTKLPYDLDLHRRCAILVGNEAHGLSQETSAYADALVRLPMGNSVESLNASVAGGILLYEVVRQRRLLGQP